MLHIGVRRVAVILRALGVLIFSADAASLCPDITQPEVCVATVPCAWLMLESRCASGSDMFGSPPSCCVSAADIACEHRTLAAAEGRCAVKARPSGRLMARRFDLNRAIRFVHLAGAAYCPASLVRDWSCGFHCDEVSGIEVKRFVNNRTHWLASFVAWDPVQNAIVVSFRGTVGTSIKNWIDDLSYLTLQPIKQYPGAKVHRGFWEAWLFVKENVTDALDRILEDHPGSASVVFTGHSLGGALATIAALDLKLEKGIDARVVNYGSPRVGNQRFAEVVAKEVPNFLRVTHAFDMVPHVPPEALGFYHVPQEVFFPDESNNYTLCDKSGEDPTCADRCGYTGCTSVLDHLSYIGMAIGTDACAVPVDVDSDQEQPLIQKWSFNLSRLWFV